MTLVIALGLAGPLRVSLDERLPRFAIDTLHRDLSLLAVALLAVHIITSVLDGFAPISLIDGVVPFTAAYRPLWLGFGALAVDLILALVLTSLVRRRLGYERWRMVHWLAYLCWPVAVLHGLGTGTDVKAGWMLVITAVCVGLVTAAIVVRVAARLRPGRRPRVAARADRGRGARRGHLHHAGTAEAALGAASRYARRR